MSAFSKVSSDVLRLLKLALFRFRSQENYQKMQSNIAKNSINELKQKGIDFFSANVLELGAGGGGYSKILNQESGAFIASDLQKDTWVDKLDIPFKPVDVLEPFPFESDVFDLIYCSSVIEHVANPDNLLKESWRVLKPGGVLFLSFPPFYSFALIGGHQFKPFHFLGERLAVRLTNLIYRSNYQDYASSFGTFGLHPLTIDRVKHLIISHQFQMLDIFTRLSPINTCRLPGLLKDLMTWHVCYLSQKPGDFSVS